MLAIAPAHRQHPTPADLSKLKPGCVWISMSGSYVIGRFKENGEWYVSRFDGKGRFENTDTPAKVQAEVRRRLRV